MILSKSTLAFLKQLKKNNRKEWFDANRELYDAARNEFVSFVQQVIDQSSKFDPTLKGINAKSCLFRINRDVRFSKDKSPYKTNFGASINKGGKKANGPGYYLHLEPGKSFIGGGIYMPEPNVLNAVRQEIDYNLDEFNKLMSSKAFRKYYKGLYEEDKLKTVPKGYAKDNPAIEHLKHKHFVVIHDLSDADVLDKNFAKVAVESFKAMYPFVQFLSRTLD